MSDGVNLGTVYIFYCEFCRFISANHDLFAIFAHRHFICEIYFLIAPFPHRQPKIDVGALIFFAFEGNGSIVLTDDAEANHQP